MANARNDRPNRVKAAEDFTWPPPDGEIELTGEVGFFQRGTEPHPHRAPVDDLPPATALVADSTADAAVSGNGAVPDALGDVAPRNAPDTPPAPVHAPEPPSNLVADSRAHATIPSNAATPIVMGDAPSRSAPVPPGPLNDASATLHGAESPLTQKPAAGTPARRPIGGHARPRHRVPRSARWAVLALAVPLLLAAFFSLRPTAPEAPSGSSSEPSLPQAVPPAKPSATRAVPVASPEVATPAPPPLRAPGSPPDAKTVGAARGEPAPRVEVAAPLAPRAREPATPDAPGPPRGASADSVARTPPAGRNVPKTAMQQALEARERGDNLRALRFASTELRSPSPSPDAMRVITGILDEARAGAERARRLAENAGGAAESTDFKDAVRLESMARSEWDDGRFESAFRWFTAARAKFARVAQPSAEGAGQSG